MFGGLNPVEDGHGDIEDHDVRAQFHGGVGRCLTVRCRAYDHASIGGQKFADMLKHLSVIVGQKNPNF